MSIDTSASDLIGKEIGGFILEAILGRGTSGTVFRARHRTRHETQAAIKMLWPINNVEETILESIVDEIETIAKLEQENLVEIFEVGKVEDQHFILMELLEGETLGDLLTRSQRLSPSDMVRIAQHVCDALSAAHSNGVIHLNLSLENIYLDNTANGRWNIKVLDCGLAKFQNLIKTANAEIDTGSYSSIPYFIAPEQARGEPVDRRSDLFSLGAILYRGLSGVMPFPGETAAEVIERLLNAPVATIAEIAPEAKIPHALDRVILRALSKDPFERQADLKTFGQQLQASLTEGDVTLSAKEAKKSFSNPLPSPNSTDTDNLLGRKIGNYVLKSIIGSGGMGTVYCALHPTLGKQVAIKVLKQTLADDHVSINRLIDEARASASVGHENIVEVYDTGETFDGITYIVMEMLNGETLDEILKRDGRLSPQEVVQIAKQICAGLGAAHQQGIIHRDIKPQNIFICTSNTGEKRIKILDFGIAKLLDAMRRTSPKTVTGAVIGTPHFMSPEQARGAAIDGRSDIYSLGIVLYLALSGALPFKGESFTEVLANMLTDDVLPITQLAPDALIPESLDRVVQRALSKNCEDRPPSMEAFAEELETALAQKDTIAWSPAPEDILAASPIFSSDEEKSSTEKSPSVAGEAIKENQAPAEAASSLVSQKLEGEGDHASVAPERQNPPSPGKGSDVDGAPLSILEAHQHQSPGLIAGKFPDPRQNPAFVSIPRFRIVLYPAIFLILGLEYLIAWFGTPHSKGPLIELSMVGISLVMLVGAFEFGFRKARRRQTSSYSLVLFLVSLCAILITYLTQLNGSTTTFAVLLYIQLVIFARLIIDDKAAFFATIISLVGYAGIFTLERLDIIPYARLFSFAELPSQHLPFHTALPIALVVIALIWGSLVGTRIIVRRREEGDRLILENMNDLNAELFQKTDRLQRVERLRPFVPIRLETDILDGKVPKLAKMTHRQATLVTIIFDDYYETVSELKPDEQARLLNELYQVVFHHGERYRLLVIEANDSSITLLTSEQLSQNEHEAASRAIEFALEILKIIETIAEEWRALASSYISLLPKIGIHSGLVMLGALGTSSRSKFTAIGAEVQIPRLAALEFGLGSIVATHSTWALCRDRFGFERQLSIRVPGFTQPLRLFLVKDPS